MDSPSPASTYYSTMDTPLSSGAPDSPEPTPSESERANAAAPAPDTSLLVNQLESMSLRQPSQSPPPQPLPGSYPLASSTRTGTAPVPIPPTKQSHASSFTSAGAATMAATATAMTATLRTPSPAAEDRDDDVERTVPSQRKNSVTFSSDSKSPGPRSPSLEPSSHSPFPRTPTDPHLTKPIVSPAPPSRRTAVIFQAACEGHRYIRTPDLAGIVERPERIRAVKTGVAAAWARLEARNVAQGGLRWTGNPPMTPTVEDDTQQLGELFKNMGIKDHKGKGKEILGGPFDLLHSESRAAVDDPAILYVHPLPNLAPDAPDVDIAPLALNVPVNATPTRASRTPATTPHRPTTLADAPSSAPPKLGSVDSEPASNTLQPWPHQLANLCRGASAAITTGPRYSEIPAHLPQGDLYLAEQSEEAIFGAIGAVCEGVDRVVQGARTTGNGYDRAFVAIRPPGHHCAEAAPMGFCFLNNVAVAAAHAHLKHGIERVVILDIDLHHGNGTQEIAWRINAEANRAAQEMQARSPRKGSPKKATLAASPRQQNLQIMYASLHDIFSYPCEDGDQAMIQAASLNLNGGHAQWISNVHLESFETEAEFHEKLYPKYRDGLLGAATKFFNHTAVGDDEDENRTLIIISAGMDASQHESAGMSRHRRNVPTSFFHRFARETVRLATSHAAGKVLAVLEGGYSDRALCSATMALMVGLTESPRLLEKTFLVQEGDEMLWWGEKNLSKIEKACKTKRGKLQAPTLASSAPSSSSSSSNNNNATLGGAAGAFGMSMSGSAPSLNAPDADAWLARTVEIFAAIEGSELAAAGDVGSASSKDKTGGAARTMQLRERRQRGGIGSEDHTPRASAQSSPVKASGATSRSAGKLPSSSPAAAASSTTASNASVFNTSAVDSKDEIFREGTSVTPTFAAIRQGVDGADDDAGSVIPKAEGVIHLNVSDRATGELDETSLPTSSSLTPNGATSTAPKVKFTWRQGGVQ